MWPNFSLGSHTSLRFPVISRHAPTLPNLELALMETVAMAHIVIVIDLKSLSHSLLIRNRARTGIVCIQVIIVIVTDDTVYSSVTRSLRVHQKMMARIKPMSEERHRPK